MGVERCFVFCYKVATRILLEQGGYREMLCVLLQSGVVDVNVGLNDVGFVVDVVVLVAVRLAIAIDHGVVCLHVSVVLVLVNVDVALGVAAIIFL